MLTCCWINFIGLFAGICYGMFILVVVGVFLVCFCLLSWVCWYLCWMVLFIFNRLGWRDGFVRVCVVCLDFADG